MTDCWYWIDKLRLQAHPEGGFYREQYRSNEIISKTALPERFSGDRVVSTSIYFLLDKGNISAFHRIKQDEVWHFYEGSSLSLHIIGLDGTYVTAKLGRNYDESERFQVILQAGCYFAAEVNNKESFSLTGCTVAPGFDFADFELPEQDKLIKLYPQHEKLIREFTKTTKS